MSEPGEPQPGAQPGVLESVRLIDRLAVSIPDAARLISFSETYFRRSILPTLPVLYSSRPRILVRDLMKWVEAHVTQPVAPRTRAFGPTPAPPPQPRPAVLRPHPQTPEDKSRAERQAQRVAAHIARRAAVEEAAKKR